MNQPFQQHPGFPDDTMRDQQEQQHQAGANFDRFKATQMAGVAVGDAYQLQPTGDRSEVIAAQETAPESMRAFAIATGVRRLRITALSETQGTN